MGITTTTAQTTITGSSNGLTTTETVIDTGLRTVTTITASLATTRTDSYFNGTLISTVLWDPPLLTTPSDISVGHVETHTSQYTAITYSNGSQYRVTGTTSITTTIVGFEDVSVPAGTFRGALRTSDGTYASWFARDVGFVRQTGPSSVETVLTSYNIP
jgi:hypothetical protein